MSPGICRRRHWDPGPDQQGVCVAVCVRLKRLRGGGKVVMYVYMLGCSVSPLPHSPTPPPTRRFFLSLRRQQHRAASGQKRRGSGSNIRPQEGSGGENEGKRLILFI